MYNPTTQPATSELEMDTTVKWLQNRAEATNTLLAILKSKGAIYKNHLLNAISKGAHADDEALAKIETWLNEKNSGISGHSESIRKAREEERMKKFAPVYGDYEGAAKEYYENGQLKSEKNFQFDRLHGLQKFYHDNGKLQLEVNYVYGDRYGVGRFYDRSGKLIREVEFEDDIIIDIKKKK
jgi:antitoxin component YwqK of YwqJK toxin-antitoxin module